jgi:tetratricopeptide (TPR) repeat protein
MEPADRPKVFISYASASRDRVGVVAGALEAEGCEVWWDHALNPGEDYRKKIETALGQCNVAVVCWTPAATVSDWVVSEADDARGRDKLIPVLLRTCPIPKPFDRLHTADLSKWTGNRADPLFQKFVEAVFAKAEGREPKRSAWRRRLFTLGSVGAIAAAVLAATLNIGTLWQVYENIAHPTATAAQVDEVLTLLKGKLAGPLDPQSEAALREGVASLLSAQDGARSKAGDKLRAGDRDGALADLQAAVKHAEQTNLSLANTYKEIGALASPDRTEEAIAAYERAVALAPQDLEAQNQLGHLYLRVGRLAEAEAAYQSILSSVDSTDQLSQAACFGNLGRIAFARGDFAGADGFHKRALAVHEKLGMLEGQGANLTNLGNVAYSRGDIAGAEDFQKRALAIHEKLGDLEGQAINLTNLGNIANEHSDLVAAAGFLNRALAIDEKLGSLEGQASALGNLGNVAHASGDFDGAEALHNRALALDQKLGNLEGQAQDFGNLGLVASARGELAKAEDYHKQALAIDEKLGIREGQAADLANLGNVAKARKDLKSAESFWRRSLALYREVGAPQNVKMVSDLLQSIGADPEKP